MNDEPIGEYDAINFDGLERRANYRTIAYREDILHILEHKDAAAIIYQIISRWETEIKRPQILKEIEKRKQAKQAPLSTEEVESMIWVYMSYNDFVRESGGAVGYNTVIRMLSYLVNTKKVVEQRENHNPHYPDYEYRINRGVVKELLKALPAEPVFAPKVPKKKEKSTQMGTADHDSTNDSTQTGIPDNQHEQSTQMGTDSTQEGIASTQMGTEVYPFGGTSHNYTQNYSHNDNTEEESNSAHTDTDTFASAHSLDALSLPQSIDTDYHSQSLPLSSALTTHPQEGDTDHAQPLPSVPAANSPHRGGSPVPGDSQVDSRGAPGTLDAPFVARAAGSDVVGGAGQGEDSSRGGSTPGDTGAQGDTARGQVTAGDGHAHLPAGSAFWAAPLPGSSGDSHDAPMDDRHVAAPEAGPVLEAGKEEEVNDGRTNSDMADMVLADARHDLPGVPDCHHEETAVEQTSSRGDVPVVAASLLDASEASPGESEKGTLPVAPVPKWNATTLIVRAEQLRKKPFSEAAHPKEVKAARKMFKRKPDLTLTEFEQAWKHWDTQWWRETNGPFTVTDLAAVPKNKSEMRLIIALEKLALPKAGQVISISRQPVVYSSFDDPNYDMSSEFYPSEAERSRARVQAQ